ncbi:MAG: helix-turn-helix transcriptional regulator [Clostridiales bacterium]|nr:helix-turn-helix transcriptional regulator [Clostridiales bacterium]
MKLQEAVSIRLIELLNAKNMTRYSLCRKIAMSESTVYNIINDRCKSINLSTLFLIAHGLDMSPSEFLDNELFDKDKIEIE